MISKITYICKSVPEKKYIDRRLTHQDCCNAVNTCQCDCHKRKSMRIF